MGVRNAEEQSGQTEVEKPQGKWITQEWGRFTLLNECANKGIMHTSCAEPGWAQAHKQPRQTKGGTHTEETT